jgi:hypothetical protein
VIEFLKTHGRHIFQTAEILAINRAVIYAIINKDEEGDVLTNN